MNKKISSRIGFSLLWGFAVLAFLVLIVVWWFVPLYQQHLADRMVDRLCAKDGGVKVYEKITLPASIFNEYGKPRVPIVNYVKSSEMKKIDLYFKLESKDIVGEHDSSSINELAVWRSVIYLYRYSDGKLLGESVSYARSGGDPIGPWHPSSYGCPNKAMGSELLREVVTMRASNKE